MTVHNGILFIGKIARHNRNVLFTISCSQIANRYTYRSVLYDFWRESETTCNPHGHASCNNVHNTNVLRVSRNGTTGDVSYIVYVCVRSLFFFLYRFTLDLPVSNSIYSIP